MPDTGAPWNIPYVAGTDLVADWPTDNQQQAEAIADALDLLPIRQVVDVLKDDTFTTSSTSYTDLTGLSVTITPTDATSKVLLIASVAGASTDGTVHSMAQFQFLRDATAVGIPATAGNRVSGTAGLSTYSGGQTVIQTATFAFMDSPATTSAITYKVQIRANAGTVYVNRTESDTDLSTRTRSISTLRAYEVFP